MVIVNTIVNDQTFEMLLPLSQWYITIKVTMNLTIIQQSNHYIDEMDTRILMVTIKSLRVYRNLLKGTCSRIDKNMNTIKTKQKAQFYKISFGWWEKMT